MCALDSIVSAFIAEEALMPYVQTSQEGRVAIALP